MGSTIIASRPRRTWRRRTVASGALALLLLAMQSFVPAFANGNPPSVECGTSDPLYVKFQITNGEVAGVEASEPPGEDGVTLEEGETEGTFDYQDDTSDAYSIVKIVMKSGQTETDPLINPAQSGTLTPPPDISHITFCFAQTPTPVTVSVELGACVAEGETSSTPVTVTISPSGGAVVEIKQGDTLIQSFTGSGGSVDLSPGSYTWTATANTGFTIPGTSSGTLTVLDCSITTTPATVSVTLGACVTDGITSSTPVTVVSSPDGSVEVTIKDSEGSVVATLSSGSVQLAPGTYTWSAVADDGFELTGPDSGTLTVLDCTPVVAPLGSVNVSLGSCVFENGVSSTPATVLIAPEGAATVTISDGDDVVASLTGSGGEIDLEPGTYSWAATAASGFTLTGDTSGTLTAEECAVVLPDRLARTGSMEVGGFATGGVLFLLVGITLLAVDRRGRIDWRPNLSEAAVMVILQAHGLVTRRR